MEETSAPIDEFYDISDEDSMDYCKAPVYDEKIEESSNAAQADALTSTAKHFAATSINPDKQVAEHPKKQAL